MDIATGAISLVLPKLASLVTDEYKLLKEARGDITFLQSELEPMKALLLKVAEVPAEQLDEQVKIWARDVRELSYDIEDKVDDFTVRVGYGLTPTEARGFKEFIRGCKDSVRRVKARYRIAREVKGIKEEVVEVNQRYARYKLGDAVTRPGRVSVDPRILWFYQETAQLVGVEAPRDEIMKMLGGSQRQLKIVSIVGFGGLGKTALAKVVYDMLQEQYDCHAFVSVSLKPDIKKVLRDVLRTVSKQRYADTETRDERQLIDELRECLKDKRYFIVIDDIWDISAWQTIKCSLIDNKCASRVILTTRKVDVAEFVGYVYRLKPLSDGNSKRLFHRRIFGCEIKCPPALEQLSAKILSKCDGLPLAIITIASMLANKPRTEEQWYNVHSSIGRGIDDNKKMHDMRRILSLSYVDLPTELRTCLLYLSMFPEDYEIEKNSLIWKWAAEGFIQDKEGQSLQDVGESYFNELVNRSFIQAISEDEGIFGRIKACRVHDIVLEFLISTATEENFVTNFDGQQKEIFSNKVRRLSLQSSNEEHTYSEGAMSLDSMRSFGLFGHGNFIPPLMMFRVLRVLDLEGCTSLESHHLKDVERLYHLRYLGLSGTSIKELPRGVSKLQFLETLDVRRCFIREFPSTLFKLRQLKRLFADYAELQKGIGNMKSLQELSHFVVGLGLASRSALKELGNLAELRLLHVNFEYGTDGTDARDLLKALCSLGNHKIQSLLVACGGCRADFMLDSWWVPPNLKTFETKAARFTKFPPWIFLHSNLCTLSIELDRVKQEDIKKLGGAPALTEVYLVTRYDPEELLLIGSDGFHCLTHFSLKFRGEFPMGVTFAPGAMQKLQILELICLLSWRAEKPNGGLNLGLENLPSLRRLFLGTNCTFTPPWEVESLEAAVKKATDAHLNHPTFNLIHMTRRYGPLLAHSQFKLDGGSCCRYISSLALE